MQLQDTMELEIEVGGPVKACANCTGTDIRRANVRSAFWHDERLVVVDEIPALVCQSCGEQYYDDETVVRLDLLRGAGFPQDQARAEIVVPVFSLSGRTAAETEE